MNLCTTCKHKNKNWCKYYNTHVFDADTCTAYRKKTIRPVRTDIKKKSIKQEKKLAKYIGAKRTPRSGADPTSPNDMIKGMYVIESKATDKKSISLKKEWLDAVKESPINLGKIPTLILEFTKTKDKFVVMDIKDFKKIIKRNKQ